MADVKKPIAMFEAKPSAKVVDVPALEKPSSSSALPSDVRSAAEAAFGKYFSNVVQQGGRVQKGKRVV